jgi:hypothetical protein
MYSQDHGFFDGLPSHCDAMVLHEVNRAVPHDLGHVNRLLLRPGINEGYGSTKRVGHRADGLENTRYLSR